MDEKNILKKLEKEPSTFTHEEWLRRGCELYGHDIMTWRFKCPACGNIQRPIDFRPYADSHGALPSDAHTVCIGRCMKNNANNYVRKAIGQTGPGPCDYAIFGLLNLSHTIVITREGRELAVFDFADEKPVSP